MIWGVGPGKSGTMSLAKQYNLAHEPRYRSHNEHIRYHYDKLSLDEENLLRNRLKEKMSYVKEEGLNGVMDGKHSFLIPLILEVDPEASFLWLVRDPLLWARSVLTGRNAFTDKDGEGAGRWWPEEGWSPLFGRLDKICMEWVAYNQEILKYRHEHPFQVVPTETLTERENVKTNHYDIMDIEVQLVRKICDPLYYEIIHNHD